MKRTTYLLLIPIAITSLLMVRYSLGARWVKLDNINGVCAETGEVISDSKMLEIAIHEAMQRRNAKVRELVSKGMVNEVDVREHASVQTFVQDFPDCCTIVGAEDIRVEEEVPTWAAESGLYRGYIDVNYNINDLTQQSHRLIVENCGSVRATFIE